MKKSRYAGLVLDEAIRLLKAIRLEKEISHEMLARLSGISRPAISHIENGKRKPTLMVALKLANGLGVPLSIVLDKAERLCLR